MPIYEYHCIHCNKNFERLAKRGQEESECPRCSGLGVRVYTIGPVQVKFKGPGFYTTDKEDPRAG